MFTLSILLMTLLTLAIGLLPIYAQLGSTAPLCRCCCESCRAAAIGGEVSGAQVFVAEHMPSQCIGCACSALTAGLIVEFCSARLWPLLINQSLPASGDSAGVWRIPFFIGSVFGLCAMYLCRWLRETPIFIELQEARKALARQLSFESLVMHHKKRWRYPYY